MKPWNRWIVLLAALAGLLLLGGCAAPTLRAEVSTFNDWKPELAGQSYAFVRTNDQDSDLQHRAYENLVRAELDKLGLREATAPAAPAIKVQFEYGVLARDLRILHPMIYDPYWYGPHFRSLRWGRPHSLFYDPFWPDRMGLAESHQMTYLRQLHLLMSSAGDGKKLYEVVVNSSGTRRNLEILMPYLVQSAFTGFPGQNGVTRQVELPMKEE